MKKLEWAIDTFLFVPHILINATIEQKKESPFLYFVKNKCRRVILWDGL